MIANQKRTYCLTFGQKYLYEPHPSGKPINPDGYIEIRAPDQGSAREKAFEVYGTAWAFLYDADCFDAGYFPAGCIGRIEAGGDGL